jgi:large subunit ribosomal protein L10
VDRTQKEAAIADLQSKLQDKGLVVVAHHLA